MSSSQHQASVLFLTNHPPEPIGGSAKRAYSTMAALCELGISVHSVSLNPARAPLQHLERLASSYPGFRQSSKIQVGRNFEILWISCLWSVKALQQAIALIAQRRTYKLNFKVVVDLSDVLANDFKQRLPPNHDAHGLIESLENQLLQSADLAIWVSEDERKSALEHYPLAGKKTHVIPTCHTSEKTLISKDFEQRLPHVVMAGAAHPHNIRSFIFGITQIWPLISRSCKTAELHVLGQNTEILQQDYGSLERIQIIGSVDDFNQQLSSYRAHLVPTISGSGIKTKVFESLSVGTPVVGTPKSIAGSGLETGQAIFVSSSAQEMATRVRHLLVRESRWQRAHHEALSISSSFNKLNFTKTVLEAIRMVRNVNT